MITTIASYIGIIKRRRRLVSAFHLLRTLLLLAALKRLRPAKKNVHVRMDKYVLHSPDYKTLSFLLKEKFVDDEYFFQTKHTRPVIIDCGAHIGVSLIYFKYLYPDAVVHCFEPSREMFAYLRLNVEANNLQNVHLCNKALFDSHGDALLYHGDQRTNFNASLVSAGNDHRHEIVETVILSGFLINVDHVALLKLDIEGAEFEVMMELLNHKTLMSRIENIIIEFHQGRFSNKKALDQIVSLLQENEYTVSTSPHFDDVHIRAVRPSQ